jgi:hypothetical protein
LKRFEGTWLDTGDTGWIDPQGYIHVMARSDDVLNVSAHRLSSGMVVFSLCMARVNGFQAPSNKLLHLIPELLRFALLVYRIRSRVNCPSPLSHSQDKHMQTQQYQTSKLSKKSNNWYAVKLVP